MIRLLAIVLFVVLLAMPTPYFADKVVGVCYGNLVEMRHDSKGSNEIRDRYGNLKETRT